MSARRRAGLAAGLALALLAGGCTSGVRATPVPSGPPPIRVASFDFPESVLLAELYGIALRQARYHVAFTFDLGPRELVEPAIEQGFVDLVPEYLGSALQFVTLGRASSSASAAEERVELVAALQRRGLVALSSAPAEDKNAIVVAPATARRLHLRTISDLAPHAAHMTFGGPPECSVRELCLKGLKRVYGLEFHVAQQFDANGDYTVRALKAGSIGAGLLFSTDGRIAINGLVTLLDDRGLQPAENVTPVLRRDVLARRGSRLAAVLDSVSARLSSLALTDLNAQVLGGASPADVAARWLAEQGLGG